MRMTKELVRKVKQACREVCGGRRAVEIGERGWWDKTDADEEAGLNFLLWGEGHDLIETWRMDSLVGCEITASHGWVALDCYCYNLPVFGQEIRDFLDQNVSVLIGPDGEIHYADNDGHNHVANINKILQLHGHPGYEYID